MEAREEVSWCGSCEAPAVWPENAASVALFKALETQWVRAGMDGKPVGLHYGNVEAAMRLRGDDPRLFDDIQLLEREVLRILAVQTPTQA
jgi:hypothetical protein